MFVTHDVNYSRSSNLSKRTLRVTNLIELMRSAILCVMLVGLALALDNGLGLTPQMGWNSWNRFACNISEPLIRKTADLLVQTGLAAKGYKYVNLDDCWQVHLL